MNQRKDFFWFLKHTPFPLPLDTSLSTTTKLRYNLSPLLNNQPSQNYQKKNYKTSSSLKIDFPLIYFLKLKKKRTLFSLKMNHMRHY